MAKKEKKRWKKTQLFKPVFKETHQYVQMILERVQLWTSISTRLIVYVVLTKCMCTQKEIR